MTVTTLIDVLRHGETEGGPRFCGSTEVPLTDAGRLQMWAAVEREPPGWSRIVTSPSCRCADFARALARRLARPWVCDERLREMHFGAWEDRTAAELMRTDAEALTRFWADPARHPPPGGESVADLQARVMSAWHEILARHAGERLLLVTHGGVSRVILCHVLGHPIGRLLEFDVGHGAMQRIRVEHRQDGFRHVLIGKHL